jgi:hypothetical protein
VKLHCYVAARGEHTFMFFWDERRAPAVMAAARQMAEDPELNFTDEDIDGMERRLIDVGQLPEMR